MSSNAEHYVGVDLGGTKILALVVSADGEVLARFKQPTQSGGAPLADQIGAAVDGALAAASLSVADLAGIGVAVPGVVDSRTGHMMTVPNLEIDDPAMIETLRGRYEMPVAIGNDVNLGTLAECWTGAGAGADGAVGIFVGTGIGGGVVTDGRLRTGAEDLAGEIGHLVLDVDGPECGCGGLGHFEALASRTAIERDIRAALEQGRESSILQHVEGDRIKSGALAAALAEGDELVTEIMARAAHYLAQGVLSIRHLLDPELIIFGGGVIEACGDFLLPLIEAEVRADPMKGSRDCLTLVTSSLGDDAVALGAAALARAEISGFGLGGLETGTLTGEPHDDDDDDDDDNDEDEDLCEYPTIDSVEFGGAVVDGEPIGNDIHIRADGKVRRRKKKRLRKKYGTSHVVDGKEIARVCKGNPELLVIGTGFQEMVRLTDDAREYLETLGMRYEVLPSPEAVEAWNHANCSKALILHITC